MLKHLKGTMEADSIFNMCLVRVVHEMFSREEQNHPSNACDDVDDIELEREASMN